MFAQRPVGSYFFSMSNVTISLPDALNAQIQNRFRVGGFRSTRIPKSDLETGGGAAGVRACRGAVASRPADQRANPPDAGKFPNRSNSRTFFPGGETPALHGRRGRPPLLRNSGLTAAQILEEMPDLEAEDLKACLTYARRRIDHPMLAVCLNP